MPYINEYSSLNAQERRQLRYKRQFKHDEPTWDDSMILLRDQLQTRLSPHARVLDFGCGHGNFVIDELPGRWGERIGFDLATEATAGNKSVERIVIGGMASLPFSDDSFDVVVSLWVLEHVAEPELVFREIARVLKPGGWFAFVTPNRRSLLVRLRRLLSKKTADRLLERFYGRENDDVFDVHYRANTARDLRRLAATSNLDPKELTENPDPSYTSFDPISYSLSKTISRLPWSWTKTHLVGLFQKPLPTELTIATKLRENGQT